MEPTEVLPRLREIVELRLSASFDAITKTAGLPPNTDRCALYSGIVDAVAWCLLVHSLSPFRRYADNRKVLLRVQRHAEAAAVALNALGCSVDDLFPWSRDLLFEHSKVARGKKDPNALLKEAGLIARALAFVAPQHADALRSADKGGRPRMVAFEILIRHLADAYASASRHKATVTYDPHRERYGGPFLRLVSALVPVVATLASELPGGKLEQPASDNARGQLVRDILRRNPKVENPTTAPRV